MRGSENCRSVRVVDDHKIAKHSSVKPKIAMDIGKDELKMFKPRH